MIIQPTSTFKDKGTSSTLLDILITHQAHLQLAVPRTKQESCRKKINAVSVLKLLILIDISIFIHSSMFYVIA